MKSTPATLSALVFLAMSTAMPAQPLKDSSTTLRVGNWSVRRSVDVMTDKVTCFGVHKSNGGFLLSPASANILIDSGIESITMRFGEAPPQPTRLADPMEKALSAINIRSHEFTQLLEAKRLRLLVLNAGAGRVTEDFDLTGIKEAVDHIRSGCPIEPPALVPVAASATPPNTRTSQEIKATSTSGKLCTDQMLARLRAAGVTDKQVKTACGSD